MRGRSVEGWPLRSLTMSLTFRRVVMASSAARGLAILILMLRDLQGGRKVIPLEWLVGPEVDFVFSMLKALTAKLMVKPSGLT